MFAKIFNQIYDSSIVESPDTRFTFMDFLVLADKNGVVDMTHEAISRRTNRPLGVIRETIAELEGPDPRSRTAVAAGARIFRLDDHRDWGWGIVNYDYFRHLASEEQRREKTKLRTQKYRKKLRESSPVTQCDAPKRSGDDSPSASAYSSLKEGVRGRFQQWMQVRKAMGKKPKDWTAMFAEQATWLNQFTQADQLEILSASIRNNWQGLFAPKQKKRPAPSYQKPTPKREPTDQELAQAQRIAREETQKLKLRLLG